MSVGSVTSSVISAPLVPTSQSANSGVVQGNAASQASTAVPPSTSANAASTTAAEVGGDGTSAIATQIDQWVQLINSGTASEADQIKAYASILGATVATGPNGVNQIGNAYYTTTTQAQRDAATAVITNSSIAKQSRTASNQFSAQSNALAHAADSAGDNLDPSTQSQLARLNQLSPQQQLLIWANTAPQTGSLDAWKAQLAQDQALQAADNAASPAPILKITLSDTAKAALASKSQTASATSSTTSTSDTTDPNTKALQTLTAKPAVTSADVGLAVLQNAAQAKATADAQKTSDGDQTGSDASSTTGTTNNDKPYQAGDRVSVKA